MRVATRRLSPRLTSNCPRATEFAGFFATFLMQAYASARLKAIRRRGESLFDSAISCRVADPPRLQMRFPSLNPSAFGEEFRSSPPVRARTGRGRGAPLEEPVRVPPGY